MQAVIILIPVGLIGLIAWIAVGVRQRTAEPFTLASATALYANILTMLGVTVALLGVAVMLKVVIGFINLPFAYAGLSSSFGCSSSGGSTICPTPPGEDLSPFRTQDLALAISLIVIGVLAVLIHRRLARGVRGLPGGMPVWVQRGTIFGFAVLYAPAALFGLIATATGIVGYIALPKTPTSISLFGLGLSQPFADAVGAAFAFTTAWAVVMVMLLRRLRRPGPVPPPVTY